MADIDEVRDVRNSLAYNLLEQYCESGWLSRAQADLYKSKYAKLHDAMVFFYIFFKNEKINISMIVK